jgi:hypothetical protein
MRFLFSRKSNMFFILITFLGVTGNIFAGGLPQIARVEQVLNWDKALAAYNAYVDYPSPDNAKALLAALPTDRLYAAIGDKNRAIKNIFSIDAFPILSEEAFSGDRIVIEIYFRLLNVADGYYTELVLSTLGRVARNQPQLFLELLVTYKDARNIKIHGYPVSFVGDGHNVHPEAARYILEKRIEALETVKDPKYAEIKEACIKQLREAINQRLQ